MLRYRHVRFLVLGAVIAASALACDDGNQAAQSNDIIAAIVEAYGGEEALRSIQGYRMRGNQVAVQSNSMIQVDRWFGRPDRLRLELAYPDHHETRLTDGTQGWAGSSGDDLRTARPMKLQAMRLQTARLDLPLRLLERKDEVERRDADAEGRIVLRLALDSDLYIDYHVEPATHRVSRMSMWMPGPPEMLFAANYDQFHEIEGVLIPFREETFAGTTVTSTFQATDFQWNPEDLESHLRPGSGTWD